MVGEYESKMGMFCNKGVSVVVVHIYFVRSLKEDRERRYEERRGEG
jgi:hypothetical protein